MSKLLLAAGLVLVLIGCKKDKDDPAPDPNRPRIVAISATTTGNALPTVKIEQLVSATDSTTVRVIKQVTDVHGASWQDTVSADFVGRVTVSYPAHSSLPSGMVLIVAQDYQVTKRYTLTVTDAAFLRTIRFTLDKSR